MGQKRLVQTLTEKILQKYAVGLPEGKLVRSGDYVSVQPAACLTHDNTWPCALKFMSMGATKIHDPKQLVTAIDHAVQDVTESNLKKLRQIREFAEAHGIVHYPAGHGIGHQLMVQEGHSWPGTFAGTYALLAILFLEKSNSHTVSGIGFSRNTLRRNRLSFYAARKNRCCWNLGDRPYLASDSASHTGNINRNITSGRDW